MTDIEQELAYWKKEVEIMHKMGKLVPSSTYEKIHRLEKKSKTGETECTTQKKDTSM